MSRKDAAIAAALALAAAVALGGLLFGDSAGAAWPGRPGPVVYVAVTPGDYRYSYETHGLRVLRPGVLGSERQLTTDPTDSDPQVSPEGRTVVFSREVEGEGGSSVSAIFAIRIDGSGLTQLTDGVGYGEPSFYPSGNSIALVGPGRDGNPDLYSMSLNGSRLRPIVSTPGAERAPTVSPNGRQIAFECVPPEPHSGHQNICSMRPDGSHRRNLTPRLGQNDEPKDPDFSPSGRLIAFSLHPGTAADIFTVRSDGSRMRALTNRGPRGGRTYPHAVGYALPAFSPAGGSLVAVARPGNGPRVVRIKLGEPKHPQPIGAVLLGSSPIWATG
jgi:dipeptidyl aminopeptidase/acylaminoacyl peptidase